MSTSKPILISGGGLASLLLAQSLRLSKIPYKIFERDASFRFRAQGYRLRLSSEGLDAIESVLDSETWQRFWNTCGKTGGSGFTAIDAVSGEETEHIVPESLSSRDGKIVGIARGDMRKIFAGGSEEHIEWGKQVTGYELTDDGVIAVFADGSKSVEGSMLIGGEGIYSKIAKQVSGGRIKVYDTGARGIHGQAPTTAFKGLGEGVFRMRDNSRPNGDVFIITNVRSGQMNDPNIEFGWTMGGQPGVIQVPNDDYSIVGKQAADIAKSIAKDWHPRFKPLFEEMNEAEAAFWKITCSTPSGVPEWPNEPRVTVIGDAAHSMTPAGGIGANTAVQDSALLGKLLREAGGYKPGVTAAYEAGMRVYASRAVHESYSTAVGIFGITIDEETTPVV
ncbi:Dual O-methyltransferase/FAD-dependent monooxygenase CTB3-like protein [Cladobotryum mycophilum]|uniref:Dual O-methyltransferase/FAD-dependent monooxygenase CTB3-like protein n=1 Tax=Cladobotryum mycophilum TaxID=491253 RepID=A0ABR0SX29_9HYPO